MIREVRIGTGDGLTCIQFLRLEGLTIRRQDELCLGLRRGWAIPEGGQSPRYLTGRAGRNMDVIPLENGARDVGRIGRAFGGPETLYGGVFVAESQKKKVGKLFRIKWLLRKRGYCFFNLYGVHRLYPTPFLYQQSCHNHGELLCLSLMNSSLHRFSMLSHGVDWHSDVQTYWLATSITSMSQPVNLASMLWPISTHDSIIAVC